ncbi:WD40-repeat-containing domain protein [Limtongia smithiae]|uniref:WD40-repeat-containing domain protein n=1 Tax=Limtongia smithiae TaxID=1125753 RepID=UPI0034D00942
MSEVSMHDDREDEEEQQRREEDGEFLDPSSALDVIPDEAADDDHPMSDVEDDNDDGEGEGDEDEEIDMSNNSTTYFDKHTDSIFLVDLHPTLPLVVTGGGDDTGYVWTSHLVPPKLVTTLSGHTDSLVAGGFSPDGEWLVTGGMDGQVRIWRAHKRGQMWEFRDGLAEVDEVTWLAFHPTQPVFAFGAADSSAWVYSLAPKLDSLCVLYGHGGACTAGVFTPATSGDEEEINLLTASEDGTVISWSVPSGAQNFKLGPAQFHYEAPWVNLNLHPSGTSVAVGSADGKVAIIGTRSGSVIATVDVVGAVGAGAGGPRELTEEERSVEGIAWCESLNVLAVGLVGGIVCIFDTGSWRVRRTLEAGDAVTKIAFVPGTTELVASGMDGVLRRWDVRTGTELWRGTGHSQGVLGFALSRDGQTLVSASDEGVALVYK